MGEIDDTGPVDPNGGHRRKDARHRLRHAIGQSRGKLHRARMKAHRFVINKLQSTLYSSGKRVENGEPSVPRLANVAVLGSFEAS
jgi:hypothetical protein